MMYRRFALLAGVVLTPGAALAQQTAAPTGPTRTVDDRDPDAIEEIVVTAQKRNERLQSVPISMTAVTAAQLNAAGVGNTLDIGAVTPGLTTTKTGNAPLLFLRGVGTALGGTPGDEGGVNLVVDGVVYTSLPGSIFSLNNIARIEVLRGPQGTLFGRNATGGVVSIITRDPQATPAMDFAVGYGNYDTVTASAYLTGGVTHTIAADLAIQYANQDRGFGTNLFNGRDVNLGREFSVRSKLLWTVGPDTIIRLAGDYTQANNSYGFARRILPGTVSTLRQVGPPGFFDINSNLQPASRLRTGGGSIKLEQGLSFAQLTSITAYRKANSGFDFDQDAGPIQLVDATFVNAERQFTQELQLTSLPASRIKWIVGGFYLNSNAREAPLTLAGLGLAAARFDRRFGRIGTKSYAGYAQTTVPLGDAFNVTGGLRYTSDRRRFVFSDISGLGIALLPAADTAKTFNKLTWRVALDRKLGDDVLLYGSVSTGFKAGSFNIINPANPPIQPENLTSYEIGLKSDLSHRRLRINLSGFYYDYKNIQVSQIVAGTTFFLNAPGKIYGADLDFEVRPARGLTFSGGFEALHGEYGDFPNAPGTAPQPAICGPNGPVRQPGPATGGNLSCPFNARGNQLVRAPDFTSSLTASYTLPTASGTFGVSATYAHSASYPWEVDGRLRQAPTDLVNGQLSWQSPDKRLTVRGWVRNLTDEHYYLQQSASLGDTGGAAAPRTYGATLEGHF